MEDLYAHVPIRSISLPSRLLHPDSLKIEFELINLKSFKSLPSSSSSSKTLQIGLTRLANLFICIEKIISQSPQIKQSFHRNPEPFDNVLNRSVGLIEVCCSIRDMFLTMQEHVRDLQSALRRRGKDCIESNVQAYISFRKKTKKSITKSLRTLKRCMSDGEHHSSGMINIIREVHGVGVDIFQYILLFLSLPEMMNVSTPRFIISKILRSGLLASDKDNHKFYNEVESVDIALCSIHEKMKKNDYSEFDVKEVQGRLNALSATIQELEAKLNLVLRCLIQNRVSLLSLVTP